MCFWSLESEVDSSPLYWLSPVWPRAGNWTRSRTSWGTTAGRRSPQPAWLGSASCAAPQSAAGGTCRCQQRRRRLGCSPQRPLCRVGWKLEEGGKRGSDKNDAVEFMTLCVSKSSLFMQIASFFLFLCTGNLMSDVEMTRSAWLHGAQGALTVMVCVCVCVELSADSITSSQQSAVQRCCPHPRHHLPHFNVVISTSRPMYMLQFHWSDEYVFRIVYCRGWFLYRYPTGIRE